MTPKPKFKIGDIVTFKDSKKCTQRPPYSEAGYWYGGTNLHLTQGMIIRVVDYIELKSCYKVYIDFKSGRYTETYSMLECEFYEYDSLKFKKENKFIGEINSTLIEESHTIT